MNKNFMRIIITLLVAASLYACKPATPILSSNTPPLSQDPKPSTPTKVNISKEGVSGLQVVYTKNDDLWVWDGEGTRQLTRDGGVSGLRLSSDGSKVAFTRRDSNLTNELWVINIDGSGERLLISSDDLEALGKSSETEEIRQAESTVELGPHAWVPGTYTIAFGTYRSIKYDGIIYHDDLNLVDVESGEKRTLLPPGSGGQFIYSPDGSRIAIFTQ